MRKGYAEYISTWQKQMDEAWKIAYEKSSKRKAADRKRWNKGPVLTELKCGDRVLVRNLTERGGPGKLRNYWESDVHVVTRELLVNLMSFMKYKQKVINVRRNEYYIGTCCYHVKNLSRTKKK